MADEQIKIDLTLTQQSIESFAKAAALSDELLQNTEELETATVKLNQTIAKGLEPSTRAVNRQIKAKEEQVKLQEQHNALVEKGNALAEQAKQEQKLDRQKKAADKAQGALSKLEASYNRVSKEVADYHAQVAQGQKLSKVEVQTLQLKTKELNKYGQQLKNVQIQMNKTAGARGAKRSFDSLGFSVAQLTRESPAFLISMNTGFMALSNNIPILVDEINRLKLANIELIEAQAAGQRLNEKRIPVWKQLTKALFSWQSLISVGVVLLTLYGAEIVKWVASLFKAEDGLDAVANAQEKWNKATEEGTKTAQKRIVQARVMITAMRDENRSYEERLKIAKELKSEFDDELDGLDARALLLEENNKWEKELAESIKNRAVAEAGAKLAAEVETKRLQLTLDYIKQIRGLSQQRASVESYTTTYNVGSTVKVKTVSKAQQQNEIDQSVKQAASAYEKAWTSLDDESRLLIQLMAGLYVPGAGKGDDATKRPVATNIVGQTVGESTTGMLKLIREQIKEFRMLANEADTLESSAGFTELADGLQEIVKEFNETGTLGLSLIDPKKMFPIFDPEKIKDIGKEAKEEFKKAVADISMAIGNELFNLGQALLESQLENINAEIQAVEYKYDKMLELAQGDEEATRQLNEEKEKSLEKLHKKELELRQKQAKLDKVNDIFNIVGNTAVAITKVMPNPVLVSLVAALGAAQLATVVANPIPQYRHGTDNHPGGLAIVGDGGVSEVIQTKSGVFLTPSKPTLTMLGKGDKVHKNQGVYRQSIINQMQGLNNSQAIEDAIASGFKKATINNYMKMPKVKVDLDHAAWILKQTDF